MRITGATYGESLPSGEYAATFPDHIQTHLGIINLPGEALLFLRITNIGGFKMAAQGQQTGAAWEWQESTHTWHNAGTTFGVSPLIYDKTGTLRLATITDGSQGYRYVTDANVIVTGDESYKYPNVNLWEYTTLNNGYSVGQGLDGCQAFLGSVLYQLTTGDARFVRVNQQGEQVAIYLINGVAGYAEIINTTLDALRTYPIFVSDPQPKPLPPKPVPPTPKPEPPKPAPIPPQPKPPQEEHMEVEIVAIKGPKDKYGRIDKSELGKGPFGWYPIHFDRDDVGDDCKFELSHPDAKYTLQHQITRAFLGLDATQFSDDIGKQFYGKPEELGRGGYEAPMVCYTPDKGMLIGYVDYRPDYNIPSCAFAVVKL